MKKLLSYSLFQNDKRETSYIAGLLASKEVFEELYPDFTVRVYLDDSIDQEIVQAFRRWGWEIVIMPMSDHLSGTMWRFLPFWDKSVDLWYAFDSDMMPTYSRRKAELYFENHSEKGFMHTKPWWDDPNVIYAGLFGAKREFNELVQAVIPQSSLENTWKQKPYYFWDETWLAKEILPLSKDKTFVYHIEWGDNITEELREDGVFYLSPVVPSFDSVFVRHHLVERYRNSFSFTDNIFPYYSDGQLVRIDRYKETEDKLKEINIRTRLLYLEHKRENILRSLEIDASYCCNLKCNYCAHHGHLLSGYATYEQIERWSHDWRDRIYPECITVLGGEPLLNPGITDILDMVYRVWRKPDRKNFCKLVTNGILLDQMPPEFFDTLRDGGWRVEISSHFQRYQNIIDKNVKLLEGIDVCVRDESIHDKWYNIVDDKRLPAMSYPVTAWENCRVKYMKCPVLMDNKLYRCQYIACSFKALEQGRLGPEWGEVLSYYVPATVDMSDEELKNWVRCNNDYPDAVCQICHLHPQTYNLNEQHNDF